MTDPAPIAACAGGDATRFRRAVAAHFTGRIDVGEERALRTHLSECAPCRRFYGRARALAGADPHTPPARERLAHGLGLRGVPRAPLPARARWWRWAAVPALAGAAVVAIRLASPAPTGGPEAPAPAARGAALVGAPALLAYRIPPHGTPSAIQTAIDERDELAFAYANPGGWPYLMIFAVDEHAHVYWYHPAWRPGAPPPVAVAARAGTGPFELPSATRHAFDGRRLMIYAVFARQPLGVEEIERAARASGGADRLALPHDVQVVRRSIQVVP